MSVTDTETGRRVKVSKTVIGHPHNIGHAKSNTEGAEQAREKLPVIEGTHYEVLAHTTWADYFVPTIIKWAHGATDNFTDREKSLENRERAKEYVDE